jgi:hypothetical protein
MTIGNFTFQDEEPGKVFIQIDGEGGRFNWSDVPSVVKTVLFWRGKGWPIPVAKEQQAIAAMAEFWKKHF